MTDQEIAKGCVEGKPIAQKYLYDKFSNVMMGVCVRYAGSQYDAQDILQEGFIKVFEKIGQYSGKGALGGWIRTIMINTALVHIRKNKKHRHVEDVEGHGELSTEDFSVLETMSANELMELISKLPDGYRTVFNLFAVEGYGHKEIAEMLGVSESTSKTQFKKARAKLKEFIALQEKTY